MEACHVVRIDVDQAGLQFVALPIVPHVLLQEVPFFCLMLIIDYVDCCCPPITEGRKGHRLFAWSVGWFLGSLVGWFV